MADITKGGSVVTDWTEVAQDVIVHSTELSLTDDIEAYLMLQAALNTATAHTGTKIIVETSHNTEGDEDWVELPGAEKVILIGTANEEAIDDDPLAAEATTITISSTVGYTVNGELRFIEDGTIEDSEIVRQEDEVNNTSIDILDGVTNSHAVSTNMYSIAISEVIAYLTAAVRRVRLVIDNTYDNDGSTLCYRLMTSRAQDIE